MEKIDTRTPDITEENIEKLIELFPQVATEVESAEGEVERAIDFDALRDLLGDVAEGQRERYQFTWPGKREAKAEARRPIDKTMIPCPEKSIDWETTENLYIEGDNLDALKLLKETYAGKIKLIYIDPPYNTGNDFIYNDNFALSAQDYESGERTTEGQLVSNPESNGRFHSDWCTMIYPRLLIAKELLSSDGVIFISIDEVESKNVRAICDEIFGANNFVGNIVWQSRTSISNDDEISTNHNHTYVYSKSRALLKFGGDAIDASDYENPDNDPRGPWKPVPIDANHAGGNTVFPITNPKTGVDYYPPNGRSWAYNPETVQELLDDGRIAFGKTGDSAPKRKLFYQERIQKGDTKTPSSLLLDAGTTKNGTEEIMKLFGGKVFDYPKPTTLLERILDYGLNNQSGIVLDFFSGSGTTGEATMRWNYVKNKHAQFILVQLPEDLDEQSKKANLDARKTMERAMQVLDECGRPHILTELSEERLKRAGDNIAKEVEQKNQQLTLDNDPVLTPDIGFRVFRVASSNFKDTYSTPDHTDQASLLDVIDNVKEGRTPEDILFQVLPAFRIPYSAHIEEQDITGKKVFDVNHGQLLACFDADVTNDVIEEIARRKPSYAVMRDLSFKDDSAAANFEELFKTFSPDTIRRVI